MILPAAVDYTENLVALSCGRLKSMSGPMASYDGSPGSGVRSI